MWGCLKTIVIVAIVLGLILFLIVSSGYWYLGTSNFEGLVRLRVQKNLESRLGRTVTIGRVRVIRTKPPRIILDDLRIANVEGSARPYFATVRQVEITGGIDSFWERVIRLGRIDVRDPRLNFEVFPEGHRYLHNFPKWKRSAPRKYQITKVEIEKMYVTGGAFEFLDHRHDVQGVLEALSAEVSPLFQKQIYEGVATSPSFRIRLKDYEPFEVGLRGGFYYKPGSLELKSVALRGRGIETFIAGKVEPLTEAVYDFKVRSRLELARVREIFRIERALEGLTVIDGRMVGKRGDYALTGGFDIAQLRADVYDLADLSGSLNITDEKSNIEIERGRYGGGTISGDYELARYAEPYPMTLDLRYDRVSLEKLFEDWDFRNSGFRGAATGRLNYAWNKDRLLAGTGDGQLTLQPGAAAFGSARYPMAMRGSSRFALDRGVIRFQPSNLVTERSKIAFSGTLRIEDLFSDLKLDVETEDLGELDRIGFNIARAAEQSDYDLLGLGGAGTVRATLKGTFKQPDVVASLVANNARYNDVPLGRAEVDLRYEGRTSVMSFERALFQDAGGSLGLQGTIGFPDRGPSPRFDLRVTANGWPVERALQIVSLDLRVSGIGTGALTVTGTPDQGEVDFDGLRIVRDESKLNLEGLIAWAPGEGNLQFDLDIGAESYPLAELIAFLELGDLPVTGDLTGTLHLEGPKKALEGAGAITIRNGTIYGEPLEMATADLLFTEGLMRATAVEIRSSSGVLTGEADYSFSEERFSYSIRGSDIDMAKLEIFGPLAGLLGGRLNITSSGAGTLERPELVLEATLDKATIAGIEAPADAPPPKFYLAIRDGRLVVRGSAFDVATIEGEGSIAESGALDGLIQLKVTDVARFLAIFAPGADVPASGNFVVDLRLGGAISPVEAIRVEGSVPVLDLQFSGRSLTVDRPMRFAFRDGRLVFEAFELRSDESTFSMSGFVGVVGDRRIEMNLRGVVEAALLQFFVRDLKASGRINVAADITGTLDAPLINGTAEIQDAQLKAPGFPQLIDNITGSLVFSGDRIKLDSLQARVGGGTVTAGGSLDLVNGLSIGRVSMRFSGTGVSIRYFEGVSTDGDFELSLSGDAERAVLQGEITVARMLYYNDFDFATSLLNLLLERRGLVPEIAASWQERVSLRIEVKADQTLAVKNNIADVTGSAELTLNGTLANPVILGRVTIDEGGKFRFQDIDYRVVRGTINFQNPFRTDPFFDITAEGRVEEYELTINLTGTLDRITPTITSDPPIGDLTLLSLLAGRIGPDQQSAALSPGTLGATGAGFLVQSLGGIIGSRVFPFADSFRLENVENLSSFEPKVTFEKRISEDLRLIVVYNTLDQHNREIVEWQVTRDWILLFTRDTDGDEYAVDARFRRRYEGRW